MEGATLDEAIYTFMLALAGIVQISIPLMMVIFSSAVLIFARIPTESGRKAIMCLRITGLFCALVWLFFTREFGAQRGFLFLMLGPRYFCCLHSSYFPCWQYLFGRNVVY